jgi:hypothetical protein
MMQSTTVRIGERDFQIGLLPFKAARPVYSKIQRLLVLNEDEIASSGLGLFMFAGFSGGVDDATLGELIEAFGAVTQVAISPTQTLPLSKDEARNLVFAGRLEDMFQWLDECVKYNFAGCMAKLDAARSTFEAKRAAKAEPKK